MGVRDRWLRKDQLEASSRKRPKSDRHRLGENLNKRALRKGEKIYYGGVSTGGCKELNPIAHMLVIALLMLIAIITGVHLFMRNPT